MTRASAEGSMCSGVLHDGILSAVIEMERSTAETRQEQPSLTKFCFSHCSSLKLLQDDSVKTSVQSLAA